MTDEKLLDYYGKKQWDLASFEERNKVNFAVRVLSSSIEHLSPDRKMKITATAQGVEISGAYTFNHPSGAARFQREMRLAFTEHKWMERNGEPQVSNKPYDIDLVLEIEELRNEVDELNQSLDEAADQIIELS